MHSIVTETPCPLLDILRLAVALLSLLRWLTEEVMRLLRKLRRERA